MLKPCGTLSFAVGSLSDAAASGGATCGLNFCAASLSGWPISGEPGGSAGDAAGAGAAAGGLAGCCAAAPIVNALTKTPASQRLRGDIKAVIVVLPLKAAALFLAPGAHAGADGRFRHDSFKIFRAACN